MQDKDSIYATQKFNFFRLHLCNIRRLYEENAKKFSVGMNTKGIIRETEKNKNGIFIELTPNLVGMAEYKEGLKYGEKVDLYIKKIDYDKKKVKVVLL